MGPLPACWLTAHAHAQAGFVHTHPTCPGHPFPSTTIIEWRLTTMSTLPASMPCLVSRPAPSCELSTSQRLASGGAHLRTWRPRQRQGREHGQPASGRVSRGDKWTPYCQLTACPVHMLMTSCSAPTHRPCAAPLRYQHRPFGHPPCACTMLAATRPRARPPRHAPATHLRVALRVQGDLRGAV